MIHDIDKNGNSRGEPTLNNQSVVNQRMAHNTFGNTNRGEDDNNQRMVFKQACILTYDENNKISSVYGYVPSVSEIPILVIAHDGEDVFEDILGVDLPTI